MSPIIVAEHLTKWYGPRPAVLDVSFSIMPGAVVGLLGPNGSGKSTILRMLTGYLLPSAGTISIAGLDVLDDALAARALVGYVPEDVPLYDWMRVREFLRFMARIRGFRGRGAGEAVDGVIDRLGLDRYRDRLIGTLSRGFRQRVSIAQALLHDPKVLILDEPTSGLDPYQVIELRHFIRSIAGRQAVLMATHVLTEIEKMADRAMILLDGRLLAVHELTDDGERQRLRFRVHGPADAVRACLEAVPDVRAVIADEAAGGSSCYVVEAVRRAGIAEDLTTSLVRQGHAVAEVTDVSGDLERVFLDLVRARLEESA